MAKFFIGAEEVGESKEVSFEEFIQLAMGRSITSGADWGGGRVEFGLSGDGMLRVSWKPNGIDVRIFSTTNRSEIPSLLLALPEERRRLPFREVEKRLAALRTLHAAVYLLETGRTEILEKALATGGEDLDSYLGVGEQLFLESIAPGSWILTVWTGFRNSYRSLLSVVAIVYTRGRDAFLTKLEAESRLKQLDVEEREFRLTTQKINYCLGMAKKLHNPESEQRLRALVQDQVRALLPDSSQEEVARATRGLLELPPPDGGATEN
jgi:hypothetical protein